jgi:hypothetical protein
MPASLSDSKKELLEKLMRGRTSASTIYDGIPHRPEGIDIPMSYAQQQIWLHSQFSTQVPIYNEPMTIYRYGVLDRAALERTFTEIVRRHEAWRTTFGWKGNELVQIVQPAPQSTEITYVDISEKSSREREDAGHQMAMEDALRPFDLVNGPLYRLRLVRFSEDEHRLYLTLHHIIFDGLSIYRIFLSELQVLYAAFSQNLPSPLPPLPVQYPDFALWQRGWVKEVAPAQLAYWRTKLEGTSDFDVLKTDHPRATIQTYRGAMVRVALDPSTSVGLREMCERLKVTPFMTLLATVYLMLWTNSQAEDLTVGTSSAGRRSSELEGLMGYFLDTVIIRANLSGDPSFTEVIMQCKDGLFGALANDSVPFSMMVKELSTGRDSSKNPFFQVMFSLEPPLPQMKEGWRFNRLDIHNGSTKFDLNMELDEGLDAIEGRLIYNTGLFDQSTIDQMVANWYAIVKAAVAGPDSRISEIVADIQKAPLAVQLEKTEVVPEAAPDQESNGFFGSMMRKFSKK